MFFVMRLRLSDHKVLHNNASSSRFFGISLRISCLLDMRLVMANSALRASLAIYHLISNTRSWNNCFIKFLKLQKFEIRNPSEKKHFLPFRVLLNIGIDPNFLFFLFSLYSEKISFSDDNIFSSATLSAII